MKIARRIDKIELSATRELYNKAKEYDNVIDLTLGDPDIKPNSDIMAAACEAIQNGNTRYSANAGLCELREIIAKRVGEEYGIAVSADEEIMVTVGGMEALYLSFLALIEEGDEVIIIGPYYNNYVQMVRMTGGVPVIINTDEASGFCPTAPQIENCITDKTKALVINSPCNPTGAVYPAELLDQIADLAVEHDITVISDEVYKSLIYENKSHESILTRPGMRERTILIDSVSKRFAMTGYRLGYIFAPGNLISATTRMQENVCACAPLPSQYAAMEAYINHYDDNQIKAEFENRRNALYEVLSEIENISLIKPKGTFYIFVNIENTGLDCMTFAYRLLEKEQVAVVPGTSYGQAYGNYIRIAYTKSEEELVQAATRIKRFIDNL